MTLQQIKSFIAVVESGSFNKAEETTFLTKQALKKQVDALESELEFQLLSRDSKGIHLTEAGTKFYHAAKKSLVQLDQLIQSCRAITREKNRLCIGNPPHPRLLLEDTINAYAKRYPDIHLDIVITKNHLIQKILNKELDIAEFIYRPNLLVDGISYQKIRTMHYNCLISNTHPLAGQPQIEPEDLARYPVGMSGTANMELYNYLRENYPKIKIQNHADLELSNIMNLCYNQGIYISKAYFTHLLSPLIIRPFHSPVTFECGVIYRTDSVAKQDSTPVSKFLELLNELYPSDIVSGKLGHSSGQRTDAGRNRPRPEIYEQ